MVIFVDVGFYYYCSQLVENMCGNGMHSDHITTHTRIRIEFRIRIISTIFTEYQSIYQMSVHCACMCGNERDFILFFSFLYCCTYRFNIVSWSWNFFFFGKGKIGTKFNLRNVYRKNDKNDILLKEKPHSHTEKKKHEVKCNRFSKRRWWCWWWWYWWWRWWWVAGRVVY